MNDSNFTMSTDWIKGIYSRYPIDSIKKIGRLIFWQDKNILKCQHFFDFDITNNELDEIKEFINNGFIIRFNYIDERDLYIKLAEWANKNSLKFSIIDKWLAPRLFITGSLSEYLRSNNTQIKKDYKKLLMNRNKFSFKDSSITENMHLWEDVLKIDKDSWKGDKKSDMFSLEREDLQYLPYLLNNIENARLKLLYMNNIPLAYSLMFRSEVNSMWYAVKWGASKEGRKHYAGIYCLLNHLEELYEEKLNISLDFWGRRSNVYDNLKNSDIMRYHIEITR